jgi:predicted nucleic acid-binding protein
LIALDTNILVYADSPDDLHGRYEKAIDIIAAVSSIENCLPLQALGEYLNVCRRKKKLEMAIAVQRASSYVDLFETPTTAYIDLAEAGDLAQAFNLQFFDALIVAVAQRSGATMLLSEDMHDGLEVDGLCIVNPFEPENKVLLADYFGAAL